MNRTVGGRVSPYFLALMLAVAASESVPAQQTRDVAGVVRARLDSTLLVGALIRVPSQDAAAVSNSLGWFRLTRMPVAPFQIEIARAGFVPDTLVVESGLDSIEVLLNPQPVLLSTVEVEGAPPELEQFLNEAEPSSITLGVVEIQRAPALVETDVLRTVQLLPGTVARNDFSVGFNVRGGETDQNLILLDGVTIFNPSHLGGLFSTFDASAVEDVHFETGAFSASYEGRLSSVVDIGVREGSSNHTNVRGQISLLSSKLLVDGPLGRGSYLAGVRRTYADAVVNTFSSETLPYYFADVVGKVTQPLGENGSFSATGYWGRDNLDLELIGPRGDDPGVDLGFSWGNRLLGLNSTHTIGEVEVSNHASVSEFSTTLGLLPGIIRYDNFAQVFTLRSMATYHPTPDRDRTVGISYQKYRMDFSLGSPDIDVAFAEQNYGPGILSGFANETWRPLREVIVSSGIRIDHGTTGADFTRVSPRASAKVFLGRRTAITASAGAFHQAVHSLRDQEQPLTIFEFWVGADSVVPVARADHFVFGLERWFGESHSISVEFYRKNYTDLVTVNRLQDLDIVGDEFIRTTGRSQGFDVHLKRYAGRYRGWIAYSFQDSYREIPGLRFSPSQDRRHNVNVVLTGPGPLGSEMGVRWGLGSPIPYTGVIGEFPHREYSAISNNFVEVDNEPIGGALNGERFPTYSRLDLSFRWAVEKWGGRLRPYLNVVNAYNRKNVFLYFFNFDESPVTRTGVSQLPLLPTFGVEFEW